MRGICFIDQASATTETVSCIHFLKNWFELYKLNADLMNQRDRLIIQVCVYMSAKNVSSKLN